MTGTACEFYDEGEEQSVKNLDLISAWLFGRITANCTLNDISYNGCSLLIPKQIKLSSRPVKIAIMSPDNSERVHVVIDAEMRWIDDEPSTSFRKASFTFLKPETDISSEIGELISHIQQINSCDLKCCVLNI
jgi:hypothetical protein